MIANDNFVVDRRILQQAHALEADGYQVEVICGFEVPADVIERHEGLKVYRFSSLPKSTGLAKRMSRIEWMPRSFVRGVLLAEKVFIRLSGQNTFFEQQVLHRISGFEFDILHIHDMPLLRVGSQIASQRGCKFVYDAHELYFAQASIPSVARLRMRWEESKYIHRPDLVLTVNSFVADKMARFYRRRDIKVLLNSAVTVDSRAESSPTLRELAQVSHDQKIVLYQGWISAERGLEYLIEASSFWRARATLVVIGYGEFLTVLRDQVERRDLASSVKFLGRMSYEELQRLTQQADVGVIPYLPCDFNTLYCSPNKFFEYIAAGVPVVSNDLPFLREKIEEFKCGRVADILDVQKFATAVMEQLSDESGRLNCQRAQLKLGWDIEKEKLLNWYATLA